MDIRSDNGDCERHSGGHLNSLIDFIMLLPACADRYTKNMLDIAQEGFLHLISSLISIWINKTDGLYYCHATLVKVYTGSTLLYFREEIKHNKTKLRKPHKLQLTGVQ